MGLTNTKTKKPKNQPNSGKNCWFGHTTSSTPHLVPNCEVKSGQATSSTALGDLAGTGGDERFTFSALFPFAASAIILLL